MGRKLIAKVPKRPNRGLLPKENFEIDLEAMTCTCPAGQLTDRLVSMGRTYPHTGEYEKRQAFHFDGAVGGACELRARCTRVAPGKGRTVTLHPQERLLQRARALQASPDFKRYQHMRPASEHRLARMVQLGLRKARCFGRTKTLFQALMAAAVANLTLIAGKMGETGSRGGPQAALQFSLISRLRRLAGRIMVHIRAWLPSPSITIHAAPAISTLRFRPGFWRCRQQGGFEASTLGDLELQSRLSHNRGRGGTPP